MGSQGKVQEEHTEKNKRGNASADVAVKKKSKLNNDGVKGRGQTKGAGDVKQFVDIEAKESGARMGDGDSLISGMSKLSDMNDDERNFGLPKTGERARKRQRTGAYNSLFSSLEIFFQTKKNFILKFSH